MPRVVRNFWAEVEQCPQAKDGGIRVTVYQRHCGEVTTLCEITGYARGDNITSSIVVHCDSEAADMPNEKRAVRLVNRTRR